MRLPGRSLTLSDAMVAALYASMPDLLPPSVAAVLRWTHPPAQESEDEMDVLAVWSTLRYET